MNRGPAHVVRRGAPTLDGSDELLYTLVDPLTGLQLRLPPPAATIFIAMRGGRRDISSADAARFVSANSPATVSEQDAGRYVRLLASLELSSQTRTLDRQLVALYRQTTEDAKARVLGRLGEIRATIPYYEGYDPEPGRFEALPIIGKSELRAHVQRLYVSHPDARYEWMSSSGTTSERVQVPHVPEVYYDGVLSGFAHVDGSLDSESRWVVFLPAECGGMACNMNPDTPLRQRSFGRLLFAPQLVNPTTCREEILERCAQEMVAWQPAVLTGSPSFLYAMARFMAARRIELPTLRAVFYHVEPASSIHTRAIEHCFGVPGRSLYVASELGWIAAERVPGKMFAAGGFIVEVVRDGVPVAPGQIGNVVVTKVMNGSPVLLRYDTRDLARLNDDGVTLGRVLGRPGTALVRRADGSAIPMDLVDAEIADKAGGAVAFYRLYRRGTAIAPRFQLDCCASGEGDLPARLAEIGRAVGQLLACDVTARRVNGIPPHRGGRMPLFVEED